MTILPGDDHVSAPRRIAFLDPDSIGDLILPQPLFAAVRSHHAADGSRGASRAVPPADGKARPCGAVVQQALAEGGRTQGRRQAPPGVVTLPGYTEDGFVSRFTVIADS
jgi:hypothetical protein